MSHGSFECSGPSGRQWWGKGTFETTFFSPSFPSTDNEIKKVGSEPRPPPGGGVNRMSQFFLRHHGYRSTQNLSGKFCLGKNKT